MKEEATPPAAAAAAAGTPPATGTTSTIGSTSKPKSSCKPPVSVDAWVTQQRAALAEEREEEREEVTSALAQLTAQECQDKGLSLLYLHIQGTSTGLYGRTCISLGPSTALRKDGTLPAHEFGSGDEVVLRAMKGGGATAEGGGKEAQQIRGVVTRTTATKIDFVASADDVDDDLLEGWAAGGPGSGHLRLDMLSNEATHQRMMGVLGQLLAYPADAPAARLVNLCFGRTDLGSLQAPTVTSYTLPPKEEPWLSGAGLNEEQRAAIGLGLATEDVALIHGPPGTGKTTAVVELILQAVRRHKRRLLVCAPSNVAVDNIVERIAAAEGSSGSSKKGTAPRIVRLGHPARLSPQALAFSLEALIEAADGTEIVRDIRTELAGLEKKKVPRNGMERRAWRGEIKALRKEIRTREERVVKQLLASRDIVLCTNVGAATRVLRDEVFDMVVIDESAQALEAACWIPMLKAPRVVLAGDHKQLAPTIKSNKASKMGLGTTLFDRLMAQLGTTHAQMLTVQYRMHADICAWASAAMYGGLLRADASVAGHTLADLKPAGGEDGNKKEEEDNDDDMTAAVLLLLDTAGCGMEEEEGERPPPPSTAADADDAGNDKKQKKIKAPRARTLVTLSRSNHGEALVVAAHVRALIHQAGLRPEDIAVITPYNAQVELLRFLLATDFPSLEIRSVDGFQGGEREAVVLSLVRSNRKKEVGFLSDERRLNVAVTRAKRHCAIVADSETVSVHPFLAGLMTHCEEHGELRSALEYVPDWAGAGGGGGGGGGVGASKAGGEGGGSKKPGTATATGKPKPKSKAAAGTTTTANTTTTNTAARNASSHDASQEGTSESSSAPVRYEDSPVPDNALIAQVLQFCLNQSQPPPRRLELPIEISGRQRKLVHDLVEGLKLNPPVMHESQGMGKKRRLVLERVVASAKDAEKGEPTVAAPAVLPPPPPVPRTDSRGGGGSISAGKKVAPLKGNTSLGSLHAERLARQQQQQKAQPPASEEEKEAATAPQDAAAQGKTQKQQKTKKGEEYDEMEALEEAIRANACMTELPNPPSEATKHRLYGWDRNPQKKDLRESLRGKLSESADKRRPAKKEEEKKGGGGGRGGGGRR